MEVFSVFATLSLVDLISGPLNHVRRSMDTVERGTVSLGRRMRNLASAMAPVALAAGVLMGALGMTTTKAMAFESAMADVAKVVSFDTRAEFDAMSEKIKELSGRIPMAAEGIASIVAAAGQSGVAKDDLTEFAEVAAKMGVAFDLTGEMSGKMLADWRAGMNLTLPRTYALADAVNYLSNNMNATAPALGEVVQRVGAAAMSCGLAETQVAALGAAFLSAGASPEVAATALKKFTSTLVRGAAMSETQANAFRSLGFSVNQLAKDMQTDAQGTIFRVLEALANKPKELQMSLLTRMFGEESIGAIAPLLQNMGNLSQAFDLVGKSALYAGSMQAEFDARSKTTENALQLLSNKLSNLSISVGNLFLPAISAAASGLGVAADAVRWLVETPFGAWLVRTLAALAAAVLALTGFSAAMWLCSSAAPALAGVLAPLKAALLGLGAPAWALIAVFGALALAYKTNFGGMADTLSDWWNKISLTVRGVLALFQNLKDGSGAIRGELAKNIKAAGLTGLVTTIARIIFRIQAAFAGFQQVIAEAFAVLDMMLLPVRRAVSGVLQAVSRLFGAFKGDEVTSSAATWEMFGRALGGVLVIMVGAKAAMLAYHGAVIAVTAITKAWTAAQWLLNVALNANPIGLVVAAVALLAGAALWLVQNWERVSEWWKGLWEGVATWAENAWESVLASVSAFGISLVEAIRGAWESVTAFFSEFSLFDSGAKLLSTFVDGIKSMAMAPVEAISGVLSKVREYLPFSDAHLGPLSQLTLSGERMMSTLAEGVGKGEAGLVSRMAASLEKAGTALGSGLDGIAIPSGEEVKAPALPAIPPAAVAFGEVPALPQLEIEAPAVPDLASLPALSVSFEAMPELPRLEIAAPAMPELAPMPPAAVAFGEVPQIELSVPSMPELGTVPEVAAGAAPAEQRQQEQKRAPESGMGRNVTITIGTLNLPNVQDVQGFVEALQAEISMMEGCPA